MPVEIAVDGNRGAITIAYANLGQLDELCGLLQRKAFAEGV